MIVQRNRHGGFLTAELLVSIGLLALILAGLGVTMRAVAAFNEYQWARQQCTAAAQAQLDSVTAVGVTIEPNELTRLWPTVDLDVRRQAGQGPWEKLVLVQVTAGTQAGPRRVTVDLSRYVQSRRPGGEGE